MKYCIALDNYVNLFAAFRAPSLSSSIFPGKTVGICHYQRPSHTKIRGMYHSCGLLDECHRRSQERKSRGSRVKGVRQERGSSVRTTHVRVSACNLMISSRNFDDAGSTGRGEKEGREGRTWSGREKGEEGRWRNARPEERTIERGRELVRAGAFPLANSHARDREKERQIER